MRLGKGTFRLLLLAGAATVVLAAVLLRVDDDRRDTGDANQAVGPASTETGLPAGPSRLARETLTRGQLRYSREIARKLDLDWAVIAAVDQIEGGLSPASESERIAAIAYTLEAHGAPADYRAAVASRGDGAEHARRVLELAARFRSFTGGRPPTARLPLELPSAGSVIAVYGQRLGVLHDGIDIDAPTGTPVRAAAAGRVVSVGSHPIFGERTCVLHYLAPRAEHRDLTTCYGNQSRIDVRPGQEVSSGETIGAVGCTGTCLRPHVHFQVRAGAGPNAPAIDPAQFLAPGAAPRQGTGAPLEGVQ